MNKKYKFYRGFNMLRRSEKNVFTDFWLSHWVPVNLRFSLLYLYHSLELIEAELHYFTHIYTIRTMPRPLVLSLLTVLLFNPELGGLSSLL